MIGYRCPECDATAAMGPDDNGVPECVGRERAHSLVKMQRDDTLQITPPKPPPFVSPPDAPDGDVAHDGGAAGSLEVALGYGAEEDAGA